MGFTTDYTETQCVRYPNAFVKFAHAGAYVAKFQVVWVEADGQGKYTWGEILNVALDGPDNKCYRVTGTTLNRTWDNNC